MTEAQFLEAVRQKYSKDSHVVIPQVRNGTGFSAATRTADAIAVCLWPSLGIHAHGYEFKDSRSDWLKEVKDTKKANEIGRFCARWTLVVSDDSIVKDGELPDAWGLSVVKESKGLVDVKKAPLRETEPPTWKFVAAVLKAAKDIVTDEAEINAKVAAAVRRESEKNWEEVKAAREKGAAEVRKELERLRSTVKAFENASGVSISDPLASARIGEAVKFVLAGGLNGQAERLQWMLNQCREVTAKIEGVLSSAEIGVH